MRLGLVPCPVCGGRSEAEVLVAWGGDVDEVALCEGPSFGTSSGQYQPGIAWKPDEEDIFEEQQSNEAQYLRRSTIRLPTEA